MERTYRIFSAQSAPEPGFVVYGIILGKEQTFRIVMERRPTLEVGDFIQLEDTFIEEHRERS